MIDFESDINSIEILKYEISESLHMQCLSDFQEKCDSNIRELRKMNNDVSHIYSEIKAINEMMNEICGVINEDPEQASSDSYSRLGSSTYSDDEYSKEKSR